MNADPFDLAEFLVTEEARAEYVRAALEMGEAVFVTPSLEVVVRARKLAIAQNNER